MRILFNNKFSHATFREEVLQLKDGIHCLTFQSPIVKDIVMSNGVYEADYSKSVRQRNRWDYERITKEMGFMPIWVFNPLQFGDKPQTVWNDDWFREGSLWNRFVEDAGIDREMTKTLDLLEILVEPINLYPDPALDFGYISVTDRITKDMLLGSYTLVFPDEDADDWFYPHLLVDDWNTNMCSFTKSKQYLKERKSRSPFDNAASLM